MRYNKAEEQVKLQEILKVPVSDINISGGLVQIKSGKEFIGSIPVIEIRDKPEYITNETDLKKLEWYKIYHHHKEEIDARIAEKLPDVEGLNCIHSIWKIVNAKDGNGQVAGSFDCFFENGEWRVVTRP